MFNYEAHRTKMKLPNIVILTTFNADMFQGYQILLIKARGDDIIIHKPTKFEWKLGVGFFSYIYIL